MKLNIYVALNTAVDHRVVDVPVLPGLRELGLADAVEFAILVHLRVRDLRPRAIRVLDDVEIRKLHTPAAPQFLHRAQFGDVVDDVVGGVKGGGDDRAEEYENKTKMCQIDSE